MVLSELQKRLRAALTGQEPALPDSLKLTGRYRCTAMVIRRGDDSFVTLGAGWRFQKGSGRRQALFAGNQWGGGGKLSRGGFHVQPHL